MIIDQGTDLSFKIKLIHTDGTELQPTDVTDLSVKLFTTDEDTYVTADVDSDGFVTVTSDDLSELKSGVIAYSCSYTYDGNNYDNADQYTSYYLRDPEETNSPSDGGGDSGGGGGDFTPDDYYTKKQSDSRFAQKLDVYSTTEVDTLLEDKANSTDVYTVEEVDDMVDDLYDRIVECEDNAKQRIVLTLVPREDEYCTFKNSDGVDLTLQQSLDILLNPDNDIQILFQGYIYAINQLVEDDGDCYYWYFIGINYWGQKMLNLSITYTYSEEEDTFYYQVDSYTIPSGLSNLGIVYANQTSRSGSVFNAYTTQGGYRLTEGGLVVVNFLNDVTQTASLNINYAGAKTIMYRGTFISPGVIRASTRALFIYTSGYYHLLAVDKVRTDDLQEVTPMISGSNATYQCSYFKTYKIMGWTSGNPSQVQINIQNNQYSGAPVTTLIFDKDSYNKPSIPVSINMNNQPVIWRDSEEPNWTHLGIDLSYIVVTIYDGKYAYCKEWWDQ